MESTIETFQASLNNPVGVHHSKGICLDGFPSSSAVLIQFLSLSLGFNPLVIFAATGSILNTTVGGRKHCLPYTPLWAACLGKALRRNTGTKALWVAF